MENYKIKVNNEAESKEAQELLEKLAYEIECFIAAGFPRFVATTDCGEDYWYSTGYSLDASLDGFRELTLAELRDLVAQSKNEQGLISGADAFNATMNGACVLWRYKENVWQEWTDFTAWSKSDLTDPSYSFKLKPRTITLNVEIPAPFEPKVGDYVYFLCSDETKGYAETTLEDTPMNWGFVQFGAWRTEEEIKQVVAALRGVIKG